ncbi:MAG: 3'-5' exonuclease [Alphaproteobacteria bacterium]
MNDTALFQNAVLGYGQENDPFDASPSGEIVLFDMEFTAWEGSQERDWSEDWEYREIIQIGAVRVKDDAKFREIDRLLLYVTPVRNPKLSDYIINLTGIDQDTIDDTGFDFPEALDIFMDFCDGARAILSYSGDPHVLVENCQLHGLKPVKTDRFGELYRVLGKRAGPEFAQTSSFDLPRLVGKPNDGRAHDAMDDAIAIATTLRVLRQKDLL